MNFRSNPVYNHFSMSTITLIVNGQAKETPEGPEGLSVQDLVVDLGLKGRAVAVEVNEEVVPRAKHSQTKLQEGDRVEIVTLVGGG